MTWTQVAIAAGLIVVAFVAVVVNDWAKRKREVERLATQPTKPDRATAESKAPEEPEKERPE